MTPHEFIRKWRPVSLTERQAAQEHFIDLCRLVGHPTPIELDPTGESYCFEKGALRSSGNPGFADVCLAEMETDGIVGVFFGGNMARRLRG